MRPFKFLGGKIKASDVASWDFHQDHEGPIGEYRIDVEWCDSFLSFLSRFDSDYTVLIDTIRMPLSEHTYIDINCHNFQDHWPMFTDHNGTVRITWLNLI